jgi:phage terminase large subunit
MPTARIPKKLKPLFTKKKRFKVAIGGRGSGKSMGFADGFIMKAQTEGAKVLCGREFQNSIDDSVYGLLAAEIERLQVPGFDVQASRIDSATGGGMRFRGLARNTESIKSLYGFKYYWGEEAQTMSAESIKLLTPSIREEDSELWFSANPRSSADPFSQRFIVPFQDELAKHGYYEDDQHLIVVINWRDNPWFPAELEAERKWDYENLPRAVYDHVWEGAFNDTVDNAIIKPEWFDAAIDAHKLDKLKEAFKPKGAKIASHDPFNGGRDAAGYAVSSPER